MTDEVIQNQIRLLGFKATKCIFESTAKENETSAPKEPKFELVLENLLFQDNPKAFVKVFKVEVKVELPLESYDFEIEYHTVFECELNVDELFLNSDFARISAPAIGFPYVRAFVSNISLQAGIPPIMLPSINFIQWAKQDTKK